MREQRHPIQLAMLFILLAGCGDQARLEVRYAGSQLMSQDMVSVYASDGISSWEWHGEDLRGVPVEVELGARGVQTTTAGTLSVRFEARTGELPISAGSVQLPLKEDWMWVVELSIGSDSPLHECFGCADARAFAIDSTFQVEPADSLWVVWGGNSIKNPVVY
jgi:hypothetical protein